MRIWLLCAALIGMSGTAWAQVQDPIGPAVFDVRATLAGLPKSEGWTPTLPADSEVPNRGLGLQGGAHVYFGGRGAFRFGVGAAFGMGRGTAVPKAGDAPEVTTRVRTLAPQLSINFGHRLGWSYISAGYGRAKVTSEAVVTGTTATTPIVPVDTGWVGAINFGGGARWFITEHVGVTLDLRWHKLGSVAETPTTLAAPRTTLFDFGFGLAFR
ncbi:MAG: hypothetical protein IT178_14200 [Acidobacteria bacterium]|nr:hypothetical protein [Acidobacteriota bacterium]